jgi:2-polyprenyl-3-methyl-5-hydroxy-6-metoxy-1,4-benzoquinol methylase
MAVQNVPADLAPYYREGYFTGDVSLDGYMDYDTDKAVTRQTYEKHCRELTSLVQMPGQVRQPTMLEIGCATGFFMEIAVMQGWNVEGIDISSYAVEAAKRKGLRATTATIESFETNNTYDCIVMQDVIEHVVDPAGMMRRVHALLNQGGFVALTTPDAGSLWARMWGKKWHAFVPPQHLFYFRVSNLTRILESCGFTVRQVSHPGKRFSIPYIFRLLYSWTGLRLCSRLAEWTANMPIKRLALPINLGDTIFLIAQKTSML